MAGSTPTLKPAYLVHGDDHGAVAERRAGLRALAEVQAGGGAGVELLEGDAATPAAVAEALARMTLAIGRRVIIVEGVERWREQDVAEHLLPAIAGMPPDTTIALFAREEARATAPAAVHQAVTRAGGQIVSQMTVKPWELAKWAGEQARRLGMSLDPPAARALVELVGERQQRLLRELEKIALEGDQQQPPGEGSEAPGRAAATALRRVEVGEIEARAAHSAERRAFVLADALVAGDGAAALGAYLRLRLQGERPSGLTYAMAQRLRDALALYDLELDSRGGSPIPAARSPLAGLAEDTL
ncbi:MAG TPA: hypothetical protein VKG62_05805, partial [Solirubrobacteraceae bacterium]|nr:hypothetical protein [Solirubrobacteraceae bacterium]